MIATLLHLVIWLIVVGVIIGLLLYILDTLPIIPDPYRQVVRTIVIVIGVLILIYVLLGFVGIVDSGVPRLR
jgi:preprotein translocase subunit SecE